MMLLYSIALCAASNQKGLNPKAVSFLPPSESQDKLNTIQFPMGSASMRFLLAETMRRASVNEHTDEERAKVMRVVRLAFEKIPGPDMRLVPYKGLREDINKVLDYIYFALGRPGNLISHAAGTLKLYLDQAVAQVAAGGDIWSIEFFNHHDLKDMGILLKATIDLSKNHAEQIESSTRGLSRGDVEEIRLQHQFLDCIVKTAAAEANVELNNPYALAGLLQQDAARLMDFILKLASGLVPYTCDMSNPTDPIEVLQAYLLRATTTSLEPPSCRARADASRSPKEPSCRTSKDDVETSSFRWREAAAKSMKSPPMHVGQETERFSRARCCDKREENDTSPISRGSSKAFPKKIGQETERSPKTVSFDTLQDTGKSSENKVMRAVVSTQPHVEEPNSICWPVWMREYDEKIKNLDFFKSNAFKDLGYLLQETLNFSQNTLEIILSSENATHQFKQQVHKQYQALERVLTCVAAQAQTELKHANGPLKKRLITGCARLTNFNGLAGSMFGDMSDEQLGGIKADLNCLEYNPADPIQTLHVYLVRAIVSEAIRDRM